VYSLFDELSNLLYRIGVSYYDSSLRQLNVLEAWDDGDKGFSIIDLGMISPIIVVGFEFSLSLYVPPCCRIPSWLKLEPKCFMCCHFTLISLCHYCAPYAPGDLQLNVFLISYGL
jgi:hypothetical protein